MNYNRACCCSNDDCKVNGCKIIRQENAKSQLTNMNQNPYPYTDARYAAMGYPSQMDRIEAALNKLIKIMEKKNDE